MDNKISLSNITNAGCNPGHKFWISDELSTAPAAFAKLFIFAISSGPSEVHGYTVFNWLIKKGKIALCTPRPCPYYYY